MNQTTVTLRELHRLHQQLADLRDRQQRGPQQIAAREVNMGRLESELAEVKEQQKRSRVAADQKELQLKTGEDKIGELKNKLNMCSSNREYQALKEQIAADEMANSVLADEILEVFEKVDEYNAAIEVADTKFQQGQADLVRMRDTVSTELERIRADLARLEVDLTNSETRLPDDIREAYDRVMRSKGSDGMAAIEGESCGGCYQSITPNTYNLLTLGKITFCGSCGRLLYLAEDRIPGSSS